MPKKSVTQWKQYNSKVVSIQLRRSDPAEAFLEHLEVQILKILPLGTNHGQGLGWPLTLSITQQWHIQSLFWADQCCTTLYNKSPNCFSPCTWWFLPLQSLKPSTTKTVYCKHHFPLKKLISVKCQSNAFYVTCLRLFFFSYLSLLAIYIQTNQIIQSKQSVEISSWGF